MYNKEIDEKILQCNGVNETQRESIRICEIILFISS